MGATGLDYTPLFILLDRRYEGEEWERMFADVRVIEHAALAAMNESKQ